MAKKVKPTKKAKASLEEIVGEQTYALWLETLRRLVPDGRTHRLSVVIAGMLQYAVDIATEKYGEDAEDGSVAQILFSGYDDNDEETLLPIIQKLFGDAGVEYERVSRGGEPYSVADEAAREFFEWFNYPWD